jgi:hypothetical protein
MGTLQAILSFHRAKDLVAREHRIFDELHGEDADSIVSF